MTTAISNIRARTKPYSDFDFPFKKHPTTGDVPIKRDVEAVKQSVRNILLTRRGEKFFDPDFGGSLTEFLFENFDPIVKAEMEMRIINTLKNRVTNIRYYSYYLLSISISIDCLLIAYCFLAITRLFAIFLASLPAYW